MNANPHTQWLIFPSPSPYKYIDGDEVFIKAKSNKELGKIGKVKLDPNPTQLQTVLDANRINVQIKRLKQGNEEDTTSSHYVTSFRPVRMIKRYRACKRDCEQKCTIIVTEKTIEYRKLASSQLDKTDNVLEIGCSNGECSMHIIKYCGSFVGYDTSSQMIAEAKTKIHPRTEVQSASKNTSRSTNQGNDKNTTIHEFCKIGFYVMDPFMNPKSAKKMAEGTNVIFIDIGGNRDLVSVLKMIQWSRENFNSQLDLIIIKSEELFKSVINDSKGQDEDESDDATQNNKRRKQHHTGALKVDHDTGMITYCEDWFQKKLDEAFVQPKNEIDGVGPPKYSHPLKVPISLSPLDGTTPICRYFNYHGKGCKKKDECSFDHLHCHWCLKKGHKALNCTGQGKLC